jgi:hypothetical protein
MVINNHHHINEKQLHPRRRRRASRGENKLIQTLNARLFSRDVAVLSRARKINLALISLDDATLFEK